MILLALLDRSIQQLYQRVLSIYEHNKTTRPPTQRALKERGWAIRLTLVSEQPEGSEGDLLLLHHGNDRHGIDLFSLL